MSKSKFQQAASSDWTPKPATARKVKAWATGSKSWWVAGLLTLGMANAYTDRVAVSVALPEISSALVLNATQQGLVLSAFFVAYAAFQIPAGWLVDRFGVRAPYVIAYLLWSGASAGTSLVGSLMSLYTLRLILGVGESIVMPASMRYIRMHFEENRRGFAIGVFMSGTKIGPALGFPLSAYLAAAFGWRWMFVLVGVVPLVLLPPYLKWVSRHDIAARSRAARQDDLSSVEPVPMLDLLRSPVILGTVIGTFCYMYFFYYSLTWMPVYFRQRFGLSLAESGWYTGLSFAGMALMSMVGGKGADWFIARGYDPVKIRRNFTLVGLGLAATQTLGVLTNSVWTMLFFSVFALSGLGLATANYWALTQTLLPASVAGTAVGIQNTAGSLAGVLAPTLTGWMIDKTGSFDAPIKAIGVWLVLGMASYLILLRRKYAPSFPVTVDARLSGS